MKALWIALKTTPVAMTAICLLCLFVLGLKISLLDDLPATYEATYRAGLVAQDLLAATLAAYIFFVLSFQIPQIIQRRRMTSAITRLINMATGRGMGVLESMHSAKHQTAFDRMAVDEAELRQIFASTHPYGEAPYRTGPSGSTMVWLEVLAHANTQCQAVIDQLWRYAQFLDTEALALMHSIENSAHSGSIKAFAKQRLSNADLSAWADSYYECYDAMRGLLRYGQAYARTYGAAKA